MSVQRFRFLEDLDNNLYLIPEDKVQEFEYWSALYTNVTDGEILENTGPDFRPYAIAGPISAYSFTKPEED
jgi:hypothetical protein